MDQTSVGAGGRENFIGEIFWTRLRLELEEEEILLGEILWTRLQLDLNDKNILWTRPRLERKDEKILSDGNFLSETFI